MEMAMGMMMVVFARPALFDTRARLLSLAPARTLLCHGNDRTCLHGLHRPGPPLLGVPHPFSWLHRLRRVPVFVQCFAAEQALPDLHNLARVGLRLEKRMLILFRQVLAHHSLHMGPCVPAGALILL